MLELENKRMEERLKTVQNLMEMDKQKRSTLTANKDHNEGTLWRSATQNQSLRGYDKQVMEKIQKTKGLPPRSS